MIESLESLGFSSGEAKVLTFINKNVQVVPIEIIKETQISASNIYLILTKLVNKGLISKLNINGKPIYKTNGLKFVNLIKEEIEKEKKKKLYQIKKIQKEIEHTKITNYDLYTDAEIFIGLTNLKIAFLKLLDDNDCNKNNGEEFIFFYNMEPKTVSIVHDFFIKENINILYKTISTRALFSKNYSSLFKTRKNVRFDYKFVDTPIPSSINIFKNKTLIIHWREKPVAFLLTSTDISENFKNLFDNVWNIN